MCLGLLCGIYLGWVFRRISCVVFGCRMEKEFDEGKFGGREVI